MNLWGIDESFYKLYDKFVAENKDNFNEMEIQRKKATIERRINKRMVWVIEIGLLIIMLAWCICVGTEEENMTVPDICFMIALFVPLIIFGKNRVELDGYDSIYKGKIIRNLFKHFSSELEFFPEESIDGIDYNQIGPGKYTSINSKDVIKGKYKNSDVLISQVKTIYTYESKVYMGLLQGWKKRKEERGEFLGLFIKVKLPKNTKMDLYLKNRTYLDYQVFNEFLENINNLEQKNIKNVEVYELNEIFEVYSSDLMSVQRLLNSEMRGLLRSINDRKNFEFAIKDEYAYIRFWGDTFFAAPQLKSSPDDKGILYENYEILYLIFLLVNKFEEM